MTEWWTYSPADFLLFSERVYWRLFELANAATWPWPIAALVLGLGIAVLVLLRLPASDRLIAAILAVAWLVAAWAFVWNQYRPVNWAAAYAAPFFVFEAALLFGLGTLGNRMPVRMRGNPGVVLGLALFAYALVLHPLLAPLAGRPLGGAEIFAVAPDPTAIATLGLVAAAGGGAVRLWLLPVPLLWCLASWATLATMEHWQAWVPLACAVLALASLVLNARRAER